MKTIFTIIFLLCGIFLQAQDENSLIRTDEQQLHHQKEGWLDSLIVAGEQFYHQKKYWKARNIFQAVYSQDKTNAKVLSNLLLAYYKTEDYLGAYKNGHTFLENTSNISQYHQANLYHNLALNCEALNYPAEALHYYQEANKIKQHSIRTNKIEQLRPVVDQLNAILPKIEKKLPEFAPPSGGLKRLGIGSHHPISNSIRNYILRKIENYHDTFEARLQPDSTLYFYPISVHSLSDVPLHILTCRIQSRWWKYDYTANFYVDNQGHIIDIPFANRFVENMLVAENGDYIMNTYYHPKGHGHWTFSTLYRYSSLDKQVIRSTDFLKHYNGNFEALGFYSNIYIQNNAYRIKYGEFDRTMFEEKDPIGDTWLYREDSINTIRVPRTYEKTLQWLNSKRFQILKHVEFY